MRRSLAAWLTVVAMLGAGVPGGAAPTAEDCCPMASHADSCPPPAAPDGPAMPDCCVALPASQADQSAWVTVPTYLLAAPVMPAPAPFALVRADLPPPVLAAPARGGPPLHVLLSTFLI